MFVFIAFAAVAHAVTKDCFAYKCSSHLARDECLKFNEEDQAYLIKPCKEDKVCNADPVNIPDTATCEDPPSAKSTYLAGEKCSNSDDCWPGVSCQSGKCKGRSRGGTCTTNMECDVGLYCKAGLCSSQIHIGHTGCLIDADCVNNAGCDINSSTNRDLNVCKEYFKLDDYETLGSCETEGEVNYLCESLFCINLGEASQCFPAPVSNHTLPVKCDSDGMCVSSKTGEVNKVFGTSCDCGYNTKGQSYCELHTGDAPYRDYAKKIKEWVDSEHSLKCNTEGRFGDNCMKTYWSDEDFNEFVYREMSALHYQLLYGSEGCTQQALLTSYWTSKKALEDEDDDDDDWAHALAAALVVLLLQ